MALTVSFGNGGNAAALTLDEADALSGNQATNGGSSSTTDTRKGETINDTPVDIASVTVPNAGGGSGTGGTVDVYAEDGAFVFDVVGQWNSVKNASAKLSGPSLHGEDVVFKDFVHVDVDFGNVTSTKDANSSVIIENVKRANVTTGFGNDTIDISLSTNGRDWQNVVDVKSGAGNDTIAIKAGSVTQSEVASTNTITDGSLTTVKINAGAGNDSIDLSSISSKTTVTGGTGDDHIVGGKGVDTFVYTSGENSGNDVIVGFEFGKDVLSIDGVTVTGFTPVPGQDKYGISLSNGGTIIFENVQNLPI